MAVLHVVVEEAAGVAEDHKVSCLVCCGGDVLALRRLYYHSAREIVGYGNPVHFMVIVHEMNRDALSLLDSDLWA